MEFFCRNSQCEYFTHPIDLATAPNQCPKCKWSIFDTSQAESSFGRNPEGPRENGFPQAGNSPPASSEETPKSNKPKPPVPPRPPSPKEKPPEPPANGGVDISNPNTTLPVGGMRTGPVHQQRLVLEMVRGKSLDPVEFIHESREMPLYHVSRKGGKKNLATLRKTGLGVELTPVDSSSSVFVRVNSALRIGNRTRFRIGDYVIEPRPSPVEPAGQTVGERGAIKDLISKGELVFIRPDGSDGLKFPVLRRILIGRGGPGDRSVDIPLLDDNVSERHASITPTENSFRLHDLKSTNGTFVQIRGPKLLKEGDWFRIGDMVMHISRFPRSG